FAVLGFFDISFLHIRRPSWAWMRSLSVRDRCFDGGPGRANSLLDLFFSRRQGVIRDVQRTVFNFGFDYAVQPFNGIGYFLWGGGSPGSFISFRASLFSLKPDWALSVFFFIFFNFSYQAG